MTEAMERIEAMKEQPDIKELEDFMLRAHRNALGFAYYEGWKAGMAEAKSIYFELVK